jgi:very-short-patch-repair endonuclease
VCEANEIHNSKYTYNKAVYVNNKVKLCITCPIHGDFMMTPNSHLSQKQGCPKCANIENGLRNRGNINTFILKAKLIHGDKYDYSKVEYENNKTKVCIICPTHGEFMMKPNCHLSQKQGCPKCAIIKNTNNQRSNTEEFKKHAIELWGDRYDYSKSVYVRALTKLTVTCKIHGDFDVTPAHFLNGHGCPICRYDTISLKRRNTKEEFVENANKIHHNKYNYDFVEYKNNHTKVDIVCPIHGHFFQKPNGHLNGAGCPKCGAQRSIKENFLGEYISSLIEGNRIDRRIKDIIKPYEIDIAIKDLHLAIEYNGIVWHSEQYIKDKNYHLNKLNKCNDAGYQLINIFEDEYANKEDAILSKIRMLVKPSDEKISYTIRRVDEKEVQYFFDYHDLVNFDIATYYYAAFDEMLDIVGAISFRRGVKGEWRIINYATNGDYYLDTVISELFNKFIEEHGNEVNCVVGYHNRKWPIIYDSIYGKEFKLDSIIKPHCKYVYKHKSLTRQELQNKYGISLLKTDDEIKEEYQAYPIWNCGYFKYIWKK